MFYTPQWMKRMEQWLSESSLQQLVRMMQHHEESYHRIQQFIENPPDDVRIFEIFPPKPLASHALGSRLPALNQDYHLGRRCGRYFLSAAAHWLLPRENERPHPQIEPRIFRQPKQVIVPQDKPENVIPLAASVSTVEQIILDPAVLTDMVADGGMVRPAAFKDNVVSAPQPQHASSDMPPPESPASSENYPSSEGENL
jgi:hypothetical protein